MPGVRGTRGPYIALDSVIISAEAVSVHFLCFLSLWPLQSGNRHHPKTMKEGVLGQVGSNVDRDKEEECNVCEDIE